MGMCDGAEAARGIDFKFPVLLKEQCKEEEIITARYIYTVNLHSGTDLWLTCFMTFNWQGKEKRMIKQIIRFTQEITITL